MSFATRHMPDSVLPLGKPAGWEAEERTAFKLVMTIGLIFSTLNFLGCMYVFYRVLRRWRITRARDISMPMSLRLPLYTAMTNFLLYVTVSVNLIYTAVNHKTWQGDNCLLVGALTFGAATLNISLYASIAVLTYMRVCREIYLDFGRYDHRIWGFIFIVTICLTLAGYGAYGEQKYWCSSRSSTPRVGVLMFAIILIINILVFVCYLLTLRDIRQIDRNTLYGTAAITGAVIERHVARKIASYLLVFLIQWIPVTIYDLSREFWNSHETWIYVLCVIGINLGGIGTAVQYILNEGWETRRPMTLQTTYAPTPVIGTPEDTKHDSMCYPPSLSSLATLTPAMTQPQRMDVDAAQESQKEFNA